MLSGIAEATELREPRSRPAGPTRHSGSAAGTRAARRHRRPAALLDRHRRRVRGDEPATLRREHVRASPVGTRRPPAIGHAYHRGGCPAAHRPFRLRPPRSATRSPLVRGSRGRASWIRYGAWAVTVAHIGRAGGRVTASVTSITYAPVKGLGLTRVDEAELEPTRRPRESPVPPDRRQGGSINGKSAGGWCESGLPPIATARRFRSLSRRLGRRGGPSRSATPSTTNFYGRPVAGHLVNGGFSEALSTFAGRPLGLVRVDEPGDGSDRGVGASVSVVSSGTLDRLAQQAGEDAIDGRRFRMLFGIDGVDAARRGRLAGPERGLRRRSRAVRGARRPLRRDGTES